jgi:hypothetical protein
MLYESLLKAVTMLTKALLDHVLPISKAPALSVRLQAAIQAEGSLRFI